MTSLDDTAQTKIVSGLEMGNDIAIEVFFDASTATTSVQATMLTMAESGTTANWYICWGSQTYKTHAVAGADDTTEALAFVGAHGLHNLSLIHI